MQASTELKPPRWRNGKLWLVLAVCLAPAIASYFMYYALPPAGRTNYGELVEPQRPLPALSLNHLDGKAFDAERLRGKWVMVQVDGGDCDADCVAKLYSMRQVRTTTGKDRDRIERLWLVADAAPLSTVLMREYDGTVFLRARPAELASFLALPEGAQAQLADHIWLIDPLGNLMLRWPRAADPNRMKKDIAKLLKASRVG
ncbi:MAG: cytochrome C oxidase subunit I [Burkholderiaceae bacterium]